MNLNTSENNWTRIFSTEKLEIDRNKFWQGVWIWNMKPNLVNRRIFASEVLHCYELLSDKSTDEYFLNFNATLPYDQLEKYVINRLNENFNLRNCSESEARTFSSKKYVLIKKTYFKSQILRDFLEICFVDYSQNSLLNYPVSCSSEINNNQTSVFPIQLKFILGKISVIVLPRWKESVNYDKLNYTLLPKLSKWAQNADSKDTFQVESGSLMLVQVNSYNELYLHWKDKYGQLLVENWTENTDPLKFVYEDIGIAVYLCLLWKNEKVNFVDLGCGNGLLVHILTQEGHNGRGIDIRPRKIWNLYQPTAKLEVKTVSPLANWKYSDADWIIGNHSDELTPWIPVFAASSSYNCKFFLLPCCAFEFNGKRYQRKNSGISLYCDYMEYIQTLSIQLGFNVKIDRLRIPSTKRICFVGDQRTYSVASYESFCKEHVEPLFQKYSALNGVNSFVPRDSVEKVRNCTKIERSITSTIEDIISKALIKKQLDIIENNKNECDVWSGDHSISFKEAILLLNSDVLKKLKKECGGLKTLLRNNHSVYLIKEGRIFFRKPAEKNMSSKWKNRPCWFFHNHPLKCPLPENKCSFSH